MQIIKADIPFTVDAESIARRMHIDMESEDGEALNALVAQAAAIARPKVMARDCFIDEQGDDFVIIDGVRFDSKLLARQLQAVHRVFAYVATCGHEVREWALGIRDPFTAYWADAIMEDILGCASAWLHERVTALLGGGKIASLNPGTLEIAWPITQQRLLFDLLGDVTGSIGVELTQSMLMVPAKSVSGLYYATEVDYQNCMICQREHCPRRQVPYDPEKAKELNMI